MGITFGVGVKKTRALYNTIPDGRPCILYHRVKTNNLSPVKIATSNKESNGSAVKFATSGTESDGSTVKFATSENESDGNAGVEDAKASNNASYITDDNVSDNDIESTAKLFPVEDHLLRCP